MKTKKELPNPKKISDLSIEEAISIRRTKRDFGKGLISIESLGQLLWAGQGITDPGKTKRAAPSAGAIYPFKIYLSVRNIKDLKEGIYKYLPQEHVLKLINEKEAGDIKRATFEQSFIEKAGVNLFLVADYEKITETYGSRGVRYVHIEAGHIAQNICLQAESLSLNTVLVGSFDDEKMANIFELEKEKLVYILSIGKSK